MLFRSRHPHRERVLSHVPIPSTLWHVVAPSGIMGVVRGQRRDPAFAERVSGGERQGVGPEARRVAGRRASDSACACAARTQGPRRRQDDAGFQGPQRQNDHAGVMQRLLKRRPNGSESAVGPDRRRADPPWRRWTVEAGGRLGQGPGARPWVAGARVEQGTAAGDENGRASSLRCHIARHRPRQGYTGNGGPLV